jgi:hypothetical protein
LVEAGVGVTRPRSQFFAIDAARAAPQDGVTNVVVDVGGEFVQYVELVANYLVRALLESG